MDQDLKELEDRLAELKGHLLIDRNELETELEKQSELYYEVCEAHARASSRRDELKVAMEEQYAISADSIRRAAEEEKAKITEASIKEQVILEKDYLDATAAYLEAKKLAELYGGLREAFDSRGKMLKELAQLYISGYYQVARVDSGGSAVREAMAGAAREVMAKNRPELPSKKPEEPRKKVFGKRA